MSTRTNSRLNNLKQNNAPKKLISYCKCYTCSLICSCYHLNCFKFLIFLLLQSKQVKTTNLIPSPEKEMLHNFPNIFSKFPVKFKQHCVLFLLPQSTQNPTLKWAVSIGQNRSEYKAHRFTAEAQSEMCSSSTLASGRVPKRSWQPTELCWLWVIRSPPVHTTNIYNTCDVKRTIFTTQFIIHSFIHSLFAIYTKFYNLRNYG